MNEASKSGKKIQQFALLQIPIFWKERFFVDYNKIRIVYYILNVKEHKSLKKTSFKTKRKKTKIDDNYWDHDWYWQGCLNDLIG